MKFIRLLLHMIRYKSAIVLVVFMALSVLIHSQSSEALFSLQSLYAALALCLVYACATCVNDLVDWEIDKINLKGHKDRPLITGEGTRKDLIILAIASAVAALAFAALIGVLAIIAIMMGLILNTIYSVRPLQISRRAELTPPYLALCYVLIPYVTGYAIAAGFGSGQFNWLYFSSFYFLFLARISLKDFRDRKGDALAKKPTLILKYGKATVCLISATSLIIGGVCLLLILSGQTFLQIIISALLLSMLVIEYKLFIAKKEMHELLSVGYGARMGNGILFTLVGTFLLQSQGASQTDIATFYYGILLIYAWMFSQYIQYPELFYFGKKKVA